jgi:uncharacterized protein with PIN domain
MKLHEGEVRTRCDGCNCSIFEIIQDNGEGDRIEDRDNFKGEVRCRKCGRQFFEMGR